MANDTDFDIDAHNEFQNLFVQFARPDLPELRKSILETLDSGTDPAEFQVPTDRCARAILRITLRQQQRRAERLQASIYGQLVSRWREALDSGSDNAGLDEDAPGH